MFKIGHFFQKLTVIYRKDHLDYNSSIFFNSLQIFKINFVPKATPLNLSHVFYHKTS